MSPTPLAPLPSTSVTTGVMSTRSVGVELVGVDTLLVSWTVARLAEVPLAATVSGTLPRSTSACTIV